MTFRLLSPILLAVEHIQQRYTGECLAACVAMACSYLGMPKDYDRLCCAAAGVIALRARRRQHVNRA